MDSERSRGLFDRLVDEGWPAPGRVARDGWIYRHAGGVTKRANSILALGDRAEMAGADLAGAIERAEKFYGKLDLPCVFSIGPGTLAGLDAELDGRGYRVADPTLIMTAPLPRAAVSTGGAALAEKIAPELSERWLRTWWRVDGGRHRDDGAVPAMEWARRIMTGIPAGYVHLDRAAPTRNPGAGVGRGVVQGEWLGVYCMAVEPDARRRGLGRSVLRTLFGWGAEHGARHAYLVVTEANTAARALYEREGFMVVGRYHYRIAS